MIKVSNVIIQNSDGYYLLQFRDDGVSSYKNQWLFFGGHLEGEESPHEAARRELTEELGIDFAPKRFKFLGDEFFLDEEGNEVCLHLFRLSIEPGENIKLGEGAGFGFFAKEVISNIATPEFVRNVAKKYF